jgi:hypothetical protein
MACRRGCGVRDGRLKAEKACLHPGMRETVMTGLCCPECSLEKTSNGVPSPTAEGQIVKWCRPPPPT